MSQTQHLITQISHICKEIHDIKDKSQNCIPHLNACTPGVKDIDEQGDLHGTWSMDRKLQRDHQTISPYNSGHHEPSPHRTQSELSPGNSSSAPKCTPSSSAPAKSLMRTMCAGKDLWDELTAASCNNKGDNSPDLPEEDVDKGGTVLPASAETKVASELLKNDTIETALPETGEGGCALPE